MSDGVTIMRQRQLGIRREMDRRGIALKQVGFDSGIGYPTLLSYFPAEGSRDPASIPMAAVFKLIEKKALPNDLLSLFMPAGWALVQVPEETDLDEVAGAMADWLAAKNEAHHPDSPAGRDIAPCEDDKLRGKLAVVAGGGA